MSGLDPNLPDEVGPKRRERWEFSMERIGRTHNVTFVFEEVDPDDVNAVQEVVNAMTRHIARHLGSRHWDWWVDYEDDVWINGGRSGRGHLFITPTGKAA